MYYERPKLNSSHICLIKWSSCVRVLNTCVTNWLWHVFVLFRQLNRAITGPLVPLTFSYGISFAFLCIIVYGNCVMILLRTPRVVIRSVLLKVVTWAILTVNARPHSTTTGSITSAVNIALCYSSLMTLCQICEVAQFSGSNLDDGQNPKKQYFYLSVNLY